MKKITFEILNRRINNIPHEIVQLTQQLSDCLEALSTEHPEISCVHDVYNLMLTQLRLTNTEARNLVSVTSRFCSFSEKIIKRTQNELATTKTHGCHDCGEERIPRMVADKLTCSECGSTNITCLED
jgi:hypothetical protein